MDRIFTRRNNITESVNFVYQLIFITLYFDVLIKKKSQINQLTKVNPFFVYYYDAEIGLRLI